MRTNEKPDPTPWEHLVSQRRNNFLEPVARFGAVMRDGTLGPPNDRNQLSLSRRLRGIAVPDGPAEEIAQFHGFNAWPSCGLAWRGAS
jgi:hypothetical protein